MKFSSSVRERERERERDKRETDLMKFRVSNLK
jgi:hypothetical protein